MESLKISTGQISLNIIGDDGEARGKFKFNPSDVESARAMLDIQKELATKQKEFEAATKECETEESKLNMLVDVVSYFKGLIDKCFGSGSSKILFGEANTLSMFFDFFEGITPYYEKASKQRIDKYKKQHGK